MGEGKVIFLGPLTGGAESCSTKLSADLLPQLFIGTMGRTSFNDICAGAQQCRSALSQRNMSEALQMVKAACQSQWHAHLSPYIVLSLPCGDPTRSPHDGLMGKPTDTQS